MNPNFLGTERSLGAWYQTPIGKALALAEAAEIEAAMPQLFGCHMVQIGTIGDGQVFRSPGVLHTTVINPEVVVGGDSKVRCYAESLPVCSGVAEAVILLHTLDFADDPHEVLREVDRILAPGGQLIIVSFNPLSMWGLRRLLTFGECDAPWRGHFFSAGRLADWLRLLNFQWGGSRSVFFRPPIDSQSMLDRLDFMERWGQTMGLPWFGASNVIVARKRPHAARPIKPRWRPRRALAGSSLAGPAARKVWRD